VYLTEGANPLHKVNILPRDGALVFTSMIPETDRLNYTKKSMITDIDVAIRGRVTEELLFGNDEITTGCYSDLLKAIDYA
jgi:ATP-dependent metalloprotease